MRGSHSVRGSYNKVSSKRRSAHQLSQAQISNFITSFYVTRVALPFESTLIRVTRLPRLEQKKQMAYVVDYIFIE